MQQRNVPMTARDYSNLGKNCYGKGELDKAISMYTKAIELDPKIWEAYLGRARTVAYQGKFAEAVYDHVKAFELKENILTKDGLVDILCFRTKADIFSAIKTLPEEKQAFLLEQCLDKNTVLGKIFFRPRGFKVCSVQSGTLKKIDAHLNGLKKSQMNGPHVPDPIPAISPTVTSVGFFNLKANLIDHNRPGSATRMHNKL